MWYFGSIDGNGARGEERCDRAFDEAYGARGTLGGEKRTGHTHPMVELEDRNNFDVLSVYHPEDEVINSVIVARKKRIVMSCKCCEPLFNHLGRGSLMEELAVKGSLLD